MRLLFSFFLILTTSCTAIAPTNGPPSPDLTADVAAATKLQRYAVIRDSARARGIDNAYLLAGIANDETNLAMCWSEATWACQGPGSPDCGGGPVIAGAADGPCSAQQGGLGMFQFDAGTFSDTIRQYGNDVLTVSGQTSHAVDYVTQMVKISAYTTNAETDDKARAWLDRFDPGNAALVDQWISTVVRYYNGCQPGWSCWNDRYRTYSDGFHLAIDEPGGLGFWNVGVGTRCGNSPAVVGEIEKKYLALGGCGSLLGAPITAEQGCPDQVGRYSVFDQGSIYWTPQLGAFEVHGRIRDAWKAAGWEAGELGYPISDEYAVTGGRRSDFQHGSITWSSSTDQTSITLTNGPMP
jgi:hypothetical protein